MAGDIAERLEQEIRTLKERQAEIQAQLDELETAARVFRRLGTARTGNGAAAKRLMPHIQGADTNKAATGPKTVREMAIAIIRERGPLHYREIASEARRRGFASQKSHNPEAPARSFMNKLYRDATTFEPQGGGVFALRSEAHSSDSGNEQQEKSGPEERSPKQPSSTTRKQQILDFLAKANGATRSDIARGTGIPDGTLSNLMSKGRKEGWIVQDEKGQWRVK